jgi:hypothetical protein
VQRCADWFVLRQFRVTGTTAGNNLLGNESVCNEVGYYFMVDSSLEQETQNGGTSIEEQLIL